MVAATLGEALRAATARIDRLDARLLVEFVSGCRHADLIAHPELPLDAAQQERLSSLVARRAAGEPLAYLVGGTEFYGLEFAVSPAVLIPRPETELLVELALERVAGLAAPRILDLGTGSGAIAVTLAHQLPQAAVTAVDLSPEALEIARGNAARHGARVNFLAGDWYAPVGEERYDLIVSNPPYVVCGDPHLDRGGLQFEPPGALTDGIAGGDGLSCIRAIVRGAHRHLADDGGLLVEHGYDQADGVQALLLASGFCDVHSWQDLAGIDRVTGGERC